MDPAVSHGGEAPHGRRREGKKTNSMAWQSARLPIRASKARAKLCGSSPCEHRLHRGGTDPAVPPPQLGMLRKGAGMGRWVVLGRRILRVAEDGLLSAFIRSAGTSPGASARGNCPRKRGEMIKKKSHLAPCWGTRTQGERCGRRGNQLEIIFSRSFLIVSILMKFLIIR